MILSEKSSGRYKTPVMEKMPPFTGGLVGYFSYDYIKYSESKLKLEDREQQDFRDMDLMLFDQVIVFDHFRQKVLLITGVMTDDLEASYEEAVREVGGNGAADPKRRAYGICTAETAVRNTAAISERKILQRWWRKPNITSSEGDIFQVVLSNPMRAKADRKPV